MTNHAVGLKVTPCLRIECKFWLGDDGWEGSSDHPPISVHANSFAVCHGVPSHPHGSKSNFPSLSMSAGGVSQLFG
jgi:hypothetical protein